MPNDNRVFPAGTGGNPTAPQIGTFGDLVTTAQPPIRPPPDPFVLKSVEPFTDDDNIPGFVDGQGNRIWHVDTSASAKAITFMSVGESTDFEYVVKWVKGANPLTIVAAGGANVGGTTTFAGVVFGDAYAFRSDGTEYHLVAQATNQSYVTSNSLSSALANLNFTGSQSFAALTVLGSSTFSGTAIFSTDCLVLGQFFGAGTAAFGSRFFLSASFIAGGQVRFLASVSFSALPTVAGDALVTSNSMSIFVAAALDFKKLGSATVANVAVATISGSWSDYAQIIISGFALTATGGTTATLAQVIAYLSTDGGTTRHLSGSLYEASVAGTGVPLVGFAVRAMGNGASPGRKALVNNGIGYEGAISVPGVATLAATSTANTGFVNQIGVYVVRGGVTATLSSGVIWAHGVR